MALALAEKIQRDEHYSPSKLAKEVGVSAPTVASWIGAKNITPAININAENLFKACECLGVRPEWILFRRGPKHPMGNAANDAARTLSPEMQAIVESLIDIDSDESSKRRRSIIIGSVGAIIATTSGE
ncbi:helix-turn-helix transcriptional regulator [Burkholderia gladioli pv. alliicola]|uniref:helix-turn-helix domain-containing protein n=1 Tax=Burkholderia gladioli TaxID=28095 RepID=UPI003D81922C